jgi:hypothetical protein
MAINVNLTGITDRDFEPVPAGKYLVEVASCELRTTGPNAKTPGAPMINWGFRILDEAFSGRMIFTNSLLGANSLWKLRQFLIAFGYTAEDLEGEFELEPDDMIGMIAMATVTMRADNQGEMRNDIRRLSAAPDVIGDEAAAAANEELNNYGDVKPQAEGEAAADESGSEPAEEAAAEEPAPAAKGKKK